MQLEKIHPSTVQRVCNKELNYTHKNVTNVGVGATS